MSAEKKVDPERREHKRKSCLISVSWSKTANIIANTIHNISHSGVFIETNEPFEIGQVISINILAPFKLKHINRINGKIVRIVPGGIGVKFAEDTPEQKENIRMLLENL